MNKTINLGLSLYGTEDKFAITASENSLNHNMELIDAAFNSTVGKGIADGSEIFNDYENNMVGGKAFRVVRADPASTEGDYKVLPLYFNSENAIAKGDYLGGKVVVSYGGGKSGQDFTVIGVNGNIISLMPNAGIIAILSDPAKMQLLASFVDCDLVSSNGAITKIRGLDISNVMTQGVVITVDSSKGFSAGQSVSIDVNNSFDVLGMVYEFCSASSMGSDTDLVVVATSAAAPIDFDNINYEKSYLTSVKNPAAGNIEIGGKYASASGTFTQATGIGAHAEGQSTIASEYAHAEGYMTEAKGMSSHAEGNRTKTVGYFAHAEGYRSQALGNGSHAEGLSKATGDWSHAEGSNCEADGECSHAEGSSNIAMGKHAHVEGVYNKAVGDNSHAEGNTTETCGGSSHAEGCSTKAYGVMSHAEGHRNAATALCDMIEFGSNQPDWNWTDKCMLVRDGDGSWRNVEDVYLESDSNYTVIKLSSVSDFTVGTNIRLRFDDFLHDFSEVVAKVDSSKNCIYIESYSADSAHAEGFMNWAKARYTHVEGIRTQALEEGAHAEGYESKATGMYSHAEGYTTTASGKYSHASGYNTLATTEAQTAIGKYSVQDDNAMFIVGTGTSWNQKKNGFTVNKDDSITVGGVTITPAQLQALLAMLD